jgi:long-chain acyl-CoA synthetase
MKEKDKKTIKLDTLTGLCLSSSARYKDRLAFAMLDEGQVSRRITYTLFALRARQIGLLLRQLGVETGGRVLLFSDNCPEWPLAYFGIAFAGAVSVPLLTGFSGEQIQYIANHSGVCAVCLSRVTAEKIDQDKFSQIPLIFIDSITETAEITVSLGGVEKQLSLTFDEENTVFPQRKTDDIATIIYTSGTQGSSKGVMLSGKNILSSALSSKAYIKLSPKDKLLSLLPLAHSYECCLGLLAPVISGASVTYLDRPPSASVLLPAVKVIRPSVIISVPLLIEKVYRNAVAPKLLENKLYKCSLTRPLAVRVAGRKLIATLGGKLRFFGIGGAPLSEDVEKFLYNAKFPYAVGYGLTEAAPLVAGHKPLHHKLRAGITTPQGVEVRIVQLEQKPDSGEGEIQVRGPNIMLGYYNDEEKTAETITKDGWLRTGDLGSIDKGMLHIRGRLKALILGPSGENIYPEEIEGLLGSSQIVEDALVYSGKRGELVALVRLTDAAKAAMETAAGAAANVIENSLEDLRSWANKKLAAFSRLSRIEIRYEPFEKTPTMKIKRYLYV